MEFDFPTQIIFKNHTYRGIFFPSHFPKISYVRILTQAEPQKAAGFYVEQIVFGVRPEFVVRLVKDNSCFVDSKFWYWAKVELMKKLGQ